MTSLFIDKVYKHNLLKLVLYEIILGQIVLNDHEGDSTRDKNDREVIGADLNLDPGLGVFDAFFASLSMILVSEVCDFSSWFTDFHR